MPKPSDLAKIILSQLLAIGVSYLLVKHIFLPRVPIVRPTARLALFNASSKVGSTVENLASFFRKSSSISLPPAWMMTDSFQPNLPPPTTYNPPFDFAQGKPPTIPPQPTTDYRPPTTFASPTIPLLPTPVPPIESLTSQEQETIDIINSRRSDMGLSALSTNIQLTTAARTHSQDMSQNSFCGHTGSDGSSPFERAQRAGFLGSAYGETVACGMRTAEQVVSAWWGSPGHKAILTHPSIKVIGVGWWQEPERTTAIVGF